MDFRANRKILRGSDAQVPRGLEMEDNFQFHIISLAEPHEIVRRVGLLFERADAIDREVAAAGRGASG